MKKKNQDKNIIIFPGGLQGGKATIELWNKDKLERGISLNPEDISRLPEQLAILTRNWFSDYILKDISFRKSEYKNSDLSGFTKEFKQEIDYKFRIKIFNLEIIWR